MSGMLKTVSIAPEPAVDVHHHDIPKLSDAESQIAKMTFPPPIAHAYIGAWCSKVQ
jgi:hypothetical protein